jgi:hypothetical protein
MSHSRSSPETESALPPVSSYKKSPKSAHNVAFLGICVHEQRPVGPMVHDLRLN